MDDRNTRILLIEDDAGDARLFQEALNEAETNHFELRRACLLKEALEYLDRGSFDVIFLDLGLPDSHGLGSLAEIMSLGLKIPVVVLTGLDDRELGLNAVKLGAQDYLVKGWADSGVVFRAMRYAIERNKLLEEIAFNAQLLKTLPNAVISTNLDHRILSWNQETEQLFGWTEEEVVGKDISFIQPLNGKQEPRESAEKLAESGCWYRECQRVNKQGEMLDILLASSVIRDERGKVIGYFGASADITERKRAEKALRQIEWLLKKGVKPEEKKKKVCTELTFTSPVKYNTSRLILDSVGEEVLSDLVSDYHDYLETCTAVFERNGDYAYFKFSSLWCQFLNQESFKLCGTDDTGEALKSGEWLCHECCWKDASKVSINTGQPADIECAGGIRIYACPIRAAGEVIGSINFAYGDPPDDPARLKEIAERFRVDPGELSKKAEKYNTRPPFIIDIAKSRLRTTARMIGEIVVRTRAEQAWQRERELLERIMETSPSGIVMVSLDGRIIFANPRAEEVLGLERKEITFRSYNDPRWMITGLDGEPPPEGKLPFQMVLESGQPVFDVRHAIQWPDGKRVFISVNAAPMYDASGKLSGMVATVENVTERIKIEKRLKESEKKYRELYDNAPVGYHELDANGIIVRVNLKEADILGYTQEEILGHSVFDFISEDEKEEELKAFQIKITGEKEIELFKRTYKRKDGSKLHCLIDENVIRVDDGRISGIRTAIQDISQQIELENQLRHAQKMESIGLLAGGIAHDFNNLLTSIMGYSSLIKRAQDLPDKQRKRILEIEKASQRGAEITRQLLTFSRKQPPKLAIIDLNSAVNQAIRFLARGFGPDIHLETALEDKLWKINADSTQIQQVLMNLCLNARDAMSGAGRLVIGTCNVEIDSTYAANRMDAKTGSYVQLTVTDTGIGMDQQTISRIFEPFFTTKDTGEGTGLGLSIVFGIVQTHGGFINVYSEVGRGSTFKVYLPRADSEETAAPEEKLVVKGGNETVLIVDDEKMIINLAASILEDYGYRCLTANNGQDAVKLFKQNRGKIDLVLMDIVMPKISGLELFEELLKIDPDVRAVMSSGFSVQDVSLLLEKGIKAFVPKPYLEKQLAMAVRQVLDDIQDESR